METRLRIVFLWRPRRYEGRWIMLTRALVKERLWEWSCAEGYRDFAWSIEKIIAVPGELEYEEAVWQLSCGKEIDFDV